MELRESVWLIGTLVYVLGMFPLWYVYQTQPFDRFGTLMQTLPLISIFGAVGLLFIYMLFGAMGKPPKDEDL